MDPTPALFISRDRAGDFCPAAVRGLTGGQGRASVSGPIRRRDDVGFQVRVFGPDLPPGGRAVTYSDLARLGFH